MGIEELNIAPMEQVTDRTANPASECPYPNCEGCSKYFTFDGERYCTVPMVITKQIFLITEEKMRKMTERMDRLEDALTDAIFTMRDKPIVMHLDNVTIKEKLP